MSTYTILSFIQFVAFRKTILLIRKWDSNPVSKIDTEAILLAFTLRFSQTGNFHNSLCFI